MISIYTWQFFFGIEILGILPTIAVGLYCNYSGNGYGSDGAERFLSGLLIAWAGVLCIDLLYVLINWAWFELLLMPGF